MPPAAVMPSFSPSVLLFLAAEQRLAGQPDLPVAVYLQDLDLDLVPHLEHIGDLGHPLPRKLGYVDQAVHPGQDLHEGAEVHDLPDLSRIDLPHLGILGRPLDQGDGLLDGLGRGRGDLYGPGILDVYLAAGPLDDGPDILPQGTDDIPDPIRIDLDGHDAGGVRGELRARPLQGPAHDLEHGEPGLAGLGERLAPDLLAQAGALDVHLQA